MKENSGNKKTPVFIDPYLKQIVDALVSHYSPVEIYLFGSMARGMANEHSDYDLLVVVSKKVERSKRAAFHQLRRRRGLIRAMDIVIFTKSNFDERVAARSSLPATVKEEGRLIYAA